MDDKIIRVYPLVENPQKGKLAFRGNSYPCALGKSGVVSVEDKIEGDGATPAGLFPCRKFFFRADKLTPPKSNFKPQAITKKMGWCDEGKSKFYNQLVALPFDQSHEVMWREDGLYDAVITLGYNDNPSHQNKGSAIFFHIARENYTPTRGCVAVSKETMLEILAFLGPDCFFRIYKHPKD